MGAIGNRDPLFLGGGLEGAHRCQKNLVGAHTIVGVECHPAIAGGVQPDPCAIEVVTGMLDQVSMLARSDVEDPDDRGAAPRNVKDVATVAGKVTRSSAIVADEFGRAARHGLPIDRLEARFRHAIRSPAAVRRDQGVATNACIPCLDESQLQATSRQQIKEPHLSAEARPQLFPDAHPARRMDGRSEALAGF